MGKKSRAGRRGKPRKRQRREPTASPRNQLRRSLEELRDRQEVKKPQGRVERRHVDDYRELSLDGTDPGQLSGALLDLTQRSYTNRDRFESEEKARLRLPQVDAEEEVAAEKLQREAERAVKQAREEMRKRGVKEREHYYSASERSQTGEVDRTYEIGSSEEAERP